MIARNIAHTAVLAGHPRPLHHRRPTPARPRRPGVHPQPRGLDVDYPLLPWVPVRQWVLTLPYRLCYLLAWDHRLSRAVLGVYARALLDPSRIRARSCRGIA